MDAWFIWKTWESQQKQLSVSILATWNHPILLDNLKVYSQRLVYLYENPVRADFVREPQERLYSSAIDYYIPNGKGLLDLAGLD